MPSSSQAPRTPGRTGIASSSRTTATPEDSATSLSTVATPPRVASRRQRTRPPSHASSSRAVRPLSGAVSETRSAASMSSPPRASMTVTPCSPIGPDTMIASPGSAADALSRTAGSTTPTPAVVM